MQYRQAVEYLNSFNKNNIRLGLKSIEQLMAILGNQQDKLKFVHVAGTNGKGSIVNYLANIMMMTGQRVGTFTSPHLTKINESISINCKNIDNQDFADAVSAVQSALVGNILEEELTSFELLTAVAFKYFYDKGCQIVILEVGMGGELDSTNIIKSAAIAVIAKISLDHTDYLGKTIADIAKVKSGIIKPNCTVVIAPQEYDEVTDIVCNKCKHIGVAVQTVNAEHTEYCYGGDKQSWRVEGLGILTSSMLGKHQIANAMTAVAAAELLGASPQCILEGIAATRWQCRLELVSHDPLVFIDGGHNLDGIRAVVEFFKEHYPQRKIKLIFGVLKDKQYDKMIGLLSAIIESVAIVQVDSIRAASIADLGAIFDRLNIKNRQCVDLYEAVADTIDNAQKDDIILITGSLYYVGKAREIVIKLLKEQL